MIVIQHQTGRLIVNIYGEFTLTDFREFERAVNDEVNFAGTVDLLLNLSDMLDFTLDMALEDIEFSRAHAHDFKKIAIVSTSQWVTWGAWLNQIFIDARMQIFSDAEDAEAWLLLEDGDIAFTTLISCDELYARLASPDTLIVDCRYRITDAEYGNSAYRQGHIPNAFFMHVDHDLASPCTGHNGRHPLPDPHLLAQKLMHCGLRANTQVIAYDDGDSMSAPRLWWLLRWMGHERVAVLDGGFTQWTTLALPITQDTPRAQSGEFTLNLHKDYIASADDVLASLDNQQYCLIDARAAERFRGEQETIDPVAGHIPSAVNHFYRLNIGTDGLFKSPDALRQDYLAVLGNYPPDKAIVYCGSGVSACSNLLAMEIAELGGARLYPGSWSEWCADSKRPIA